MSCYLIRYRCVKRDSKGRRSSQLAPVAPVTDVIDDDSMKEGSCESEYTECFERNGPPAPERDWFGCEKCDDEGNYENLKRSHPMSREQHCIDRVTGQEIPGSRRSRQQPLDCQVYQKPKIRARQPKKINYVANQFRY